MKKKELLKRIELLEKRVDELEKRQINMPPITYSTPDSVAKPWEREPYIIDWHF